MVGGGQKNTLSHFFRPGVKFGERGNENCLNIGMLGYLAHGLSWIDASGVFDILALYKLDYYYFFYFFIIIMLRSCLTLKNSEKLLTKFDKFLLKSHIPQWTDVSKI